jgi:hypothetical protein
VTFQVTAWFAEFCTVAVNCRLCRTFTVALVGETVAVTGGFTTPTVAVLETPPSGLVTVTLTTGFGEGALPA